MVFWLLFLSSIIAWAHFAGNGFTTNFRLNGTASQAATDLLSNRFPSEAGGTGDIVFKANSGVNNPIVRQEVQALLSQVRQVNQVTSTQSPYDNLSAGQVSPDGKIAFAVIQFNSIAIGVSPQTLNSVQNLADHANNSGLEVELGGGVFSSFQPRLTSLAVGISAAVVILLIAFGSVIAMGLPVINALVGIGIGIGLVELLAHLIPLPSFSTQLGAMLGVGVGIDYSLLIVTRYRQGLANKLGPEAAVVAAAAAEALLPLLGGLVVARRATIACDNAINALSTPSPE